MDYGGIAAIAVTLFGLIDLVFNRGEFGIVRIVENLLEENVEEDPVEVYLLGFLFVLLATLGTLVIWPIVIILAVLLLIKRIFFR